MAKATAKNVKLSLNREAHISATFNNIIISLTNKRVKLFLGLQVKWVLEVLKEHSMAKWQKIVVK
jgi:hypothetical protein